MKGLREFEIPYVGLKVGIHKFEYDIDGTFFSHFEDSPISDCRVHVRLEFEKKETFFILRFFIDGTVNVECDRCLEPFDKSIFGDFTCYVKFAENPKAMQDDEVLYISRDQSVIDVSHLVYEYVNLCLPMQRIHPKKENGEDGCNPEVLKFLRKGNTTDKQEKTEEPDPRWEALKNIKSKN
ncbi:MAG: DUF177 domain-containing protein [Chitinophagales bacterium]|nr:DUF177 domain-containing protein [Chitinophagales bacterium]